MKKALLIFTILLLTGCVSVEIKEDNKCYRYVDYNGEENYINWAENDCFTTYGNMFCKEGKRRFQVLEYEILNCPKEESEE